MVTASLSLVDGCLELLETRSFDEFTIYPWQVQPFTSFWENPHYNDIRPQLRQSKLKIIIPTYQILGTLNSTYQEARGENHPPIRYQGISDLV